jgi:hypothetical protein
MDKTCDQRLGPSSKEETQETKLGLKSTIHTN